MIRPAVPAWSRGASGTADAARWAATRIVDIPRIAVPVHDHPREPSKGGGIRSRNDAGYLLRVPPATCTPAFYFWVKAFFPDADTMVSCGVDGRRPGRASALEATSECAAVAWAGGGPGKPDVYNSTRA